MTSLKRIAPMFCLMAAVMMVAGTAAEATPWGGTTAAYLQPAPAAGISPNPNIDYSWSAGDGGANFGTPTLMQSGIFDKFVFTSAFMTANAGQGQTISEIDSFSMNIHMANLNEISRLEVAAFGTYDLGGPAGTSRVRLDASMTLTDLDNPGGFWTPHVAPFTPTGLATSPNWTESPRNTGAPLPTWFGLSGIDMGLMIPPFGSNVGFAFDVDLQAQADDVLGASATLNMQFSQIEIQIIVIPEPSSIALLGLGVLPLLRRRRR